MLYENFKIGGGVPGTPAFFYGRGLAPAKGLSREALAKIIVEVACGERAATPDVVEALRERMGVLDIVGYHFGLKLEGVPAIRDLMVQEGWGGHFEYWRRIAR